MTYLSKKTNSNKGKYLLGAAFLALLLFLNFYGTLLGFVADTFLPIFRAGDIVYKNVANSDMHLWSRSKLISELEFYMDREKKYKIDLADYDSIRNELIYLKQQMDLMPNSSVASYVIARSPQIPFDTIMIDKGEKDNIKENNLVLAMESIVIGVVKKVDKNFSIVSAFSDPNTVLQVQNLRTGHNFEIRGAGSGNFTSKVASDFDIQIGDYVHYTNKGFFTLAQVFSIEEDKILGFKNVFMQSPINPHSINILYVLNNND